MRTSRGEEKAAEGMRGEKRVGEGTDHENRETRVEREADGG